MRTITQKELKVILDKHRVMHPIIKSFGDSGNGLLIMDSPVRCRGEMIILFSNGGGWDHVSVSLKSKKIPNWEEMCFVKDLLFDSEEVVVQFHPRKSEYVDNHPCLHLWKNQTTEFPTPDSIMVGLITN